VNPYVITAVCQLLTGLIMVTFCFYGLTRRQQLFDRIQRDMRERVGKAGVFIIRFGKPSDLIYPGVGGIGLGLFLSIRALVRLAGL